jgi:flagellar export protein FliJ
MTSSLDQLVRVNRWKVDEKSRDLAKLLEDAERLRKIEQVMANEYEAEKRTAENAVENAITFGAYSESMLRRRDIIASERARLEKKIDVARDALRVAMGEAKKFEIAAASRAAKEQAALRAKENEALDEAALNGFRRQQIEDR